MHENVFSGLIQYEEVGGDSIERIHKMGLVDIFKPIMDKYGEEMDRFNKVLFYLLYAYSRESDLHVASVDWAIVRKEAGKKAGFNIEEDELFRELFTLNCVEFSATVRLYLDYQGSKAFKHLLMLKDLYDQMLNGAIENIKDSSDLIWWEQKVRNAKHAGELYFTIGEWEQRILEDGVKVNKASEHLRDVEKKRKSNFSLRMEDNLQ